MILPIEDIEDRYSRCLKLLKAKFKQKDELFKLYVDILLSLTDLEPSKLVERVDIIIEEQMKFFGDKGMMKQVKSLEVDRQNFERITKLKFDTNSDDELFD